MPRAKREAVEAIYGVFRTADDLADLPGLEPADRHGALAEIERDLEHIRDPDYESGAAWFPAVRRAFARFPIDANDALRLIGACRRDVDGFACETMEDLERYCAAVAGTVGRCAMPILGAADPDSLERAERLGIALQLTNVLRDVESDRNLGRNYLPRAFAGEPIAEIRRRIAERARQYYGEASVLAKRLPNDGSRFALLAAADLYEGVLDGPLSRTEKLRRILRSFARTLSTRAQSMRTRSVQDDKGRKPK